MDRIRNFFGASLALCAVFLSGCGGDAASRLEAEDIEPRGGSVGLEGRTVTLRRRSSACGSPASDPLIAEVGDEIEFPPMATADLESPCALGPNPRLEVSVEGRSVLFDFSTVEQPGVFAGSQFEGYEVFFVRSCGDVVVAGVSVDATLSTPSADEVRVSHHYDRIDVDFRGLAYDQTSFVKVDLELADVSCVRDRGGL